MNRAQEQRHLAQANGHIAELKVQIVRQRAIVKYALDTGQQSEMAESMLLALEDSLGAFEKHRELSLVSFCETVRVAPAFHDLKSNIQVSVHPIGWRGAKKISRLTARLSVSEEN